MEGCFFEYEFIGGAHVADADHDPAIDGVRGRDGGDCDFLGRLGVMGSWSLGVGISGLPDFLTS